MSENTGTTPLCAHCGRPIISTTLRYGNSGEMYHAECTLPDWAAEIERLRLIEDAARRLLHGKRNAVSDGDADQWAAYDFLFAALSENRTGEKL